MIDWQRMARPQADGYDTEQIIPLALERYGWTKTPPAPGVTAWAGGTVAILEAVDAQSEHITPAPTDHAHVARADEIFRDVWPEMYAQAQGLLQSVTVYFDDRSGIFPLQTGCSCGPLAERVSFEMSTTINGALGMLEGVVHEMGHSKLKPMGVSMYHWERLVANLHPTAEAIASGVGAHLYKSPIRKDKLRPIGACFSAHYSYLHVCELLHRVVRAGVVPFATLEAWIDVMHGRIRAGEALVEEHLESTHEGLLFFLATTDWANELLAFEA